MRSKSLIIVSIANIFFILLLALDYFIPNDKFESEIFESFYNVTKGYPGKNFRSGKEIRYLLECKGNKIYYIHKFPEKKFEIKKGTKIEINKSILFSKVKFIRFSNLIHDVSFLSDCIVIILLSFSILISILYLKLNHQCIEFAFAIAIVFLIFLSYIFFY